MVNVLCILRIDTHGCPRPHVLEGGKHAQGNNQVRKSPLKNASSKNCIGRVNMRMNIN